jgi:HAD superfamily hydrolase (TIGR01509 family)
MIEGCVFALDGVLISLEQTGAPPPVEAQADEVDRALHAHASERALLASLTLRGAHIAPGTADHLEALAATCPLVLLSEQSRRVTGAVLELTGWHDLFRVVVTADDAMPRPDSAGYFAALARLPRVRTVRNVLAVESTADGVHAARGAGCLVVACGRPIEGVPFIEQVGDLDGARIRALHGATTESDEAS